MNSKSEHAQQLTKWTFFLLMLAIVSCDVLEADQKVSAENVSFKEEALQAYPGSPTVIDLRALIANGVDARIAVTSQPTLGVLKSIGTDLLQYTPNTGISDSTDAFKVSIFNDNNVIINEDTVLIVIAADSTVVPGLVCALYAAADSAYHVTGPVDIHVLANDTSCVAPSQLVVSLPDMVDGVPAKPSFGTLEILSDGRIRYTPGAGFSGIDKFMYRVTKPSGVPDAQAGELIAHATVYIHGVADCRDSLKAYDDIYIFDLDSMLSVPDSVYLTVAANDLFCAEAVKDYVYTLTELPVKGIAGYWSNGFMYAFGDSVQAGYIDRFRYKVCLDDVCDEAEVTIKFE